MLVIPAIDLKGGRCVRLFQGDMRRETVYADDPTEVARRWQAEGARRLHLVDLDGAVSGASVNATAIVAVCRAVDIPVEVGGGIRSLGAVEEVLRLGATWAILGTVALRQPEILEEACRRFPGRVLVGIDARAGRVAVSGWTETTEVEAAALARRCAEAGAREIIFTDIERDGTQAGVNAEAAAALARAARLPVIASGGVASLGDIRRLKAVERDGVKGVIIGRSLYTGALTLGEAIREAEGAQA